MKEMPDIHNVPVDPKQDVVKTIDKMAENRAINRDQQLMATRVLEDADFALLANRAFVRGADPEFLRKTVPDAMELIADRLGLSHEDAHNAIKRAHSFGPGSFEEDSAQEWLWLIMAKHSIDEMRLKGASAAQIARMSAYCIVDFEHYGSGDGDVVADARAYRDEMIENNQPIGVAALGDNVPLYASDIGHYVAYRSGHSIAAVEDSGGLIFYGTDSSVSLADAGIKVDKELSPYFGIVFPS